MADSNVSTTKHSRITPRNSDTSLEKDDSTSDTPWRTLNKLANIPRTPLRRASSAGPTSTLASQRRTPATRTPGGNLLGSARRPVAVTPHGRAAQRELEFRRSGFTPGKGRRASNVQRRHTPRDDLRALSRLLAPKTKATEYTPDVSKSGLLKSKLQQDDSDDEALERPRLSMALLDDEDDDSLLLPPKSTGLENEENTLHSVELGRRAHSEMPPSRNLRGSFGIAYISDIGDESGLDGRSEVFDTSFLPFSRGEQAYLDDDGFLQAESTGVLRGLGLDRARLSLASGRESGVRLQDTDRLNDGDTFVFDIPQRDPADFPSSSPPVAEESLLLAGGENDAENLLPQLGGSQDMQEIDENDEDPPDEVMDEADISAQIQQQLDADSSIIEVLNVESSVRLKSVKTARKKKVKLSKHGIEYPSLPIGVVKNLATSFARTAGSSKSRLSKETLDAIMQASDWFFEQASEDLGKYAGHAGRKTIDESDVITLMTRQRQTNSTTTPFSLAQKYLPRELLQELRMVPPSKFKASRHLQSVVEEEEEE